MRVQELLSDISYYSNGGITYEAAYRMPVHIRNLQLQFLNKKKEEEKKQADAAKSKNRMPSHYRPSVRPPAMPTQRKK